MNILDLKTVDDTQVMIAIIKSYRKHHKISQTDLAGVVGITQSYLSKIEKGVSRDVPMDLIIRILEAIGLSLMIGKIEK